MIVPKVCSSNLSYIQKIIDHANANPDAWHSFHQEVGTDVFSDAYDTVIRKVGLASAHVLIARLSKDILPHTNVGLNCVTALLAYDDCGYMLDSHPGELEILAKFGDGRAILLLSACQVLHGIQVIID